MERHRVDALDAHAPCAGVGGGVLGLGCGVWVFGRGAKGLEFRVWGVWCVVCGVGFGGLGFRVLGFGSEGLGFMEIGVPRVWVLGVGV